MDWYLMAWQKYFDFSGRSRRKEYWMFLLFNLGIGIALLGADLLTGSYSKSAGMGLLGGLYSLATLIPNLSITVRRLHDTGRSGCLLAYLLPERFDMEHFVRYFQRRAIAGITVVFVATTGLTAIAPRATFDQRKAADGQAAFVRGMDGFLAAAKALQQDQLDVKAGKETERESDDKSRVVYAPMYRKVLMDLSQVSLQPNDPRLPLLQDAKRMSELVAESLEMPSVYKNGSDKPEPADPVRAEAITIELKKLSAHFQQEVQKINAKK